MATRAESLLFKMPPSISVLTRNFLPTSCGSISLPLKANADDREITLRSSILERALIKPSVTPSQKYSWFGSPVRFLRGRTATDRTVSGRPTLADGRSREKKKNAAAMAEQTAAAVATASIGLRLDQRQAHTGGDTRRAVIGGPSSQCSRSSASASAD